MITVPRRVALSSLASFAFVSLFSRSAAADLKEVTTKIPRGRVVTAYLSLPLKTPAPAVLLLHGGYGLRDSDKSTAVELAKEGFVGLVFDYYASPTEETISTWIEWLKNDQRTNGKVGVIGFSSGAALALERSISTPVDATVLYFGLVPSSVEKLTHLHGPVLGQFSDRGADPYPKDVVLLESKMKQAGKSFEVHWYAADHGWVRPESSTYNKDAAEASWAITIRFLRDNLQ
jgi:carboxymethylenebutenolidase